MADVVNRNFVELAVNFVDNPIVSDTKPVETLSAVEFD
jgi:hypothetical protein